MSEISQPTGDAGTRTLGALFGIAVLAFTLLQPALLVLTLALIVLTLTLLRGQWHAGGILFGVVYPLIVGFLMARYDNIDARISLTGGVSLDGYAWVGDPNFWLTSTLLGIALVLAYRMTRATGWWLLLLAGRLSRRQG